MERMGKEEIMGKVIGREWNRKEDMMGKGKRWERKGLQIK